VPRLPEWQERLFRGVAVLALAYSVYYIVWRWTATLNPDALWFSVPLALAETWAVLTAFITIHSVWRLRHREPLPAAPGWSVDVFITCYDEPLEVIRRTAVGARAIRYPHTTYILDDGKREEVRAMAQDLGVEYIRRDGNEHAKAGNLNNALLHSRGDYILQLDADHVPLPHILDRLLGFFGEDPKLAFVQSPQDFYNTDGFTYDLDESARRIWEEQRLFFTIIQPGKDARNAAFFCGSCAVIRRAALDDIGGFSTHSITEDIETSLRLHARGWSSAFYGESLAYGLAPGSATAFHTQHLRWGQGAMQVLRKFNPLTYPGLTLSQRISYFGSLTAYVSGVQRLILYTAPLVFFFTGAFPVRAPEGEFLARFVPFLVLSFVLSELMARGTFHAWISERYGMAKFWTHTRAVASYFSRRPLRFNVTPKGPGDVPFRSYAPHVVLMGTTLAAVLWAVAARRYGWVDYHVPGWSSGALLINLLWAALNFALAAAVVQLSRRVRQQRGDYRFRDEFPISLKLEESDPGQPSAFVALTENLNPNGMGFRSGRRLEPGARIEATLPLITATVGVSGTVVHSEPVPGAVASMFRTGVRFHDVPMDARDAIELHCAHHAVPLEKAMYGEEIPLLSRTTRWMRDARSEPRRSVHLPARVWIGRTQRGGEEVGKRMGFLQDVSASGARLVLDEPVPPGSPVRYYVPGTDIRG
ncbi:MAG: glycosyltransferase, partial [Gemmatimonadota bacterium]|nr:glycosyltransferase [Gemmatimonadota bacterium]